MGKPRPTLRILAGEARGRPLVAPEGLTTRPTPARARAAIMNSWQQRGPLGVGFDGFAGSGALGIEALSRGASHVVFAEIDAQALRALRANLAQLPASLRARATVLAMPFLQALATVDAGAGPPLDWVYADPPFALNLWPEVAEAVRDSSGPARSPCLLLEHPSERSPFYAPGWVLWRARRFGQVTLSEFARPAPA